jgi:hypothetical protein
MSSFIRDESPYPPAMIVLDPYSSDTSPHSARLSPADFTPRFPRPFREILPVRRTKPIPPELSRQQILDIRRSLSQGKPHPAEMLRKATTTHRQNCIFEDAIFYQGLSRPPRISVEHQLQWPPAAERFPCLIPHLHNKQRFWVSVEANSETTPVYFDTHLVSAGDDLKDAKEVFDELVTQPRLYGFDDDQEEPYVTTFEDLANRDVLPCEEGNVMMNPSQLVSRLSRASLDPRHRPLPDVDLLYSPLTPLLDYDARFRRGYEHDAVVTESEYDEDENLMDVDDSSDEGNGSQDDVDMWWEHDATWGEWEVGPFDVSLGTMEELFH